MNQGLAAATGRLRRVLQQRHGPARRLGRHVWSRRPTPTRTPPSSCPALTAAAQRPRPSAPSRATEIEVLAAVLGAAGRGDLRHARPTSSSELGAWGEEYEIASGEDVDLVLQGVGQRPRHRLRPAGARGARRQGLGVAASTTGRRSGRATGGGSSTSGRVTRCRRGSLRAIRSGSTATAPSCWATADWMARDFATREKARQRPKLFGATVFFALAERSKPEWPGAGCGPMFHRRPPILSAGWEGDWGERDERPVDSPGPPR